MAPLAILVAGDPVAAVQESRGGFDALIRDMSPVVGVTWLAVSIRGALPDPEGFGGFIITGSASSVTERAPWMLNGARYVRESVSRRKYVLGICFGQQLLAQALGGEVQKNPRGLEIGTVRVRRLVADPLLGANEFLANTTHRDSIATLPPGAVRLAETDREPCAAVRFSDRAWGVQFHPEMDAAVMQQYLEARADAIAEEGLSLAALIAGVRATPGAASVLRRFIELASRE